VTLPSCKLDLLQPFWKEERDQRSHRNLQLNNQRCDLLLGIPTTKVPTISALSQAMLKITIFIGHYSVKFVFGTLLEGLVDRCVRVLAIRTSLWLTARQTFCTRADMSSRQSS